MKTGVSSKEEQSVTAEVANFLQERAKRDASRYQIFLFPQAAQKDADKYLYLPVKVQGEGLDAYDKALILQELQEAWNEQKPPPTYHVTLRPAGVPF